MSAVGKASNGDDWDGEERIPAFESPLSRLGYAHLDRTLLTQSKERKHLNVRLLRRDWPSEYHSAN